MAKTNAELQALEQPQSRNEEFLNYITGRATDLNALPIPKSRIEEYLEYLCHNGGIGGGQPQPFNGVENVTYDEARNRTIFKIKGGQEEIVVEGLVTKWKDLDHVEQYQYVNLMEYNKKVTGYYYGNANPDKWTQHSDWSTYFLDVKPNESYTVIRRINDSVRYVFTSSVGSVKINAGNYGGTLNNGFYFSKITIPNNAGITKMAIQFKHNENTINDIMILRGHYDSIDGFTPYADGQVIQIGTDISYAFDNEGTSLKSTTVSSVIKELSEKIDENILPITDYQPINQFNGKEMVLGKRYDTNGNIVSDAYYATYDYPCTAGQTFTIAKRTHDDDRCVYLTQDNQIVQATTIPRFTRNEIIHYRVTVPNDNTIAKIGFNIKTTVNTTQVMIFDGHNDLPAGTIFAPYLAERLIDGDKVLHSFNNVGTNLSSTTTKEAIEELALSKVDKYTTTFNRFKSYKDYSAKYYRIPSLLATNKGTLLSFADIRYNTANDQSLIDIGVARSIDDGTLWNNAIAMKNDGTNPTQSRVMDTTSVVTSSGKIIVLAGGWSEGTSNWTQSTETPTVAWNPYIVTSDDDGLTWSNKRSLKTEIPNQPQNTVAWLGGVGTGIVKKKGNNIGRIILPIQICTRTGTSNTVKAGCIYSDDDGVNWRMSTRFTEDGNSENMIAEIGNGDLIMIARRDSYASKSAFISRDGGETWDLEPNLSGMFTHGRVSCQGSWITIESNGQTIGLLSHPKNTSNSYQRDNITIYMYNFDNPSQGVTELYSVYPYLGNASGAGYSSLCYYKNIHGVNKLAIAFETNGNIEFRDITDALYSKNMIQINNRVSELYDRKVDKYTPSNANDLTVESLKIAGNPIKEAHTSVGSGLAGTKTLAGNKNAYVQADTKISKIQVGLHGYLEGEKVTGVEVYAVKRDDDTIVERIIYEGIGVAKYPLNRSVNDVLFVDVEINKSFTEDVYFIARLKHNRTKGMYLCGADNANGIAFDKTTDNEELTQGTPIVARSSRFASILVYGGVSLSDAVVNVELNNANGINFTKANGTITTVNIPNTGTVTSVNGQTPNQQGAVTVNAEHIGYNGNTSNIIATNVQEAIDKLKRDVNLINGATIYIVQDNTELSNLLNRNVVNHGDLIYIINSTGVVDFNNRPANGGNPVAMILDDAVGGNKLRVFSKFSSNVNVSANNVSYDDQTTNLQANNVQGAIGKLNEKITNAGTVKRVNGQVPNQQDGNVTIDGTHINATVGTETLNIQEHLGRMNNKAIQAEADAQMARSEVNVLTNHVNTNVINRINGHETSINNLNGTTNDHSTRIRALERKVPTVRVGDLIQTFADNGDSYIQGGVEYVWLGKANNLVQRAKYPALFDAFGLASGTNAFNLPHIADQSVGFDYGKNRFRKTYIVAKIS